MMPLPETPIALAVMVWLMTWALASCTPMELPVMVLGVEPATAPNRVAPSETLVATPICAPWMRLPDRAADAA